MDVRAVTAWSLLGAYDWDSLVTRPQGHYEPGAFELVGGVPRPTPLAALLRGLADEGRPELRASRVPGWWRRPERLLYPPVPRHGVPLIAQSAPAAEKKVNVMSEVYDILCLSHLRWDFVYQRPQHLLSRFARRQRVFFFEEPLWDAAAPTLDVSRRPDGVFVVVPHLPCGLAPEAAEAAQRALLTQLLRDCRIERYALWVYTPMALGFAQDLKPLATVYDCDCM